MPRFTIVATLLMEMPITADTRTDALKQFARSFPNCVVQATEGLRVIGYCQRSSLPVFADDLYEMDKDGSCTLIEFSL